MVFGCLDGPIADMWFHLSYSCESIYTPTWCATRHLRRERNVPEVNAQDLNVYTSHLFKRALSHKSICSLFTKWPGILWMGFVSETSWPEMKSITGNNNRRVLQTLLYFKHVAIFRINFTHIEASVTLYAFCFNNTISWKRYVFYLMDLRM